MYSHIYINIYIFYLNICISDTYSVYNPSRSIKSNYWEWQKKHTYLWNSQVNVLYLVFSLGMLHQEWSMTLQCTNQMKLNKMGRIPQVVSFSINLADHIETCLPISSAERPASYTVSYWLSCMHAQRYLLHVEDTLWKI